MAFKEDNKEKNEGDSNAPFTPEEQRALRVKKTLEYTLLQDAVGSNLVRNDPFLYGKIGQQSAESIYHKSMYNEDAAKEKAQIKNLKLAQGKKLGVFGEPTVTDYDLSMKLAEQLEFTLQDARISELYDHVKSIGAEINSEVPEELKNYSLNELAQKSANAQGQIDPSKLDEKEQAAYVLHENLSKRYKRALTEKASRGDYYADLDQEFNSILEAYNQNGESNN